jgi:hypothetical protein
MKTFLSIDIDYWEDEIDRLQYQFHLMMRRIDNIPIIAVMNHQQMLLEVNSSKAHRLINIDAHSDLASYKIRTLCCGSWVSFVNWRQQGQYVWIRRRQDPWFGSCNGNQTRSWSFGTDWKTTNSRYIHEKNLKLTNYLHDCVGVGICMSPAYAQQDAIKVLREIVNQYNIPYRKGWKSEKQERVLRPPGIKDPIIDLGKKFAPHASSA